MSRRRFWIIFIILLCFAVLVRLWKLGELPASPYWDEAAMLVDLKSLVSTGMDMHARPWFQVIYPSYGDYKLPLLLWSSMASALFFGPTLFALRLPSALAGVLTVAAAGYLARLLLAHTRAKYSDRDLRVLQLLTMAVVTITPWSILFSRTGFEGHLGQALLTLSLVATFHPTLRQRWQLIWISPFLAAAATYSYYSVRFVWPLVFLCAELLILANYWSLKRAQTTDWLKKAVPHHLLRICCSGILFALFLLPMLRSPLANDMNRFRLGTDSVLQNEAVIHESNLYTSIGGNSIIERLLYHRHTLTLRELAMNYSDHLSIDFLFFRGDANLRHGTGATGLFLAPMVVFFLTGLLLLSKRHPLLCGFHLFWWLVALLPASVPETTPHALRSLNSLTPLTILIGLGLFWWWQRGRVIQIISALTLAIFFAYFWWHYTGIYPTISANAWQSGYMALAHTVTKQAEKNTVFVELFDDRFYLWLMLTDTYSPEKYQTWTSKDYKFQTAPRMEHFPGIIFGLPNEQQLDGQGQSIIVGRTEVIEAYCSELRNHSCINSSAIHDEQGNQVFALSTIEKLALQQ